MKKIERLKLSTISKDSLDNSEMNKIYGGVYCAMGEENKKANQQAGTCSCYCYNNNSYSSELRNWGSFDKHSQ